LRKGFVLLKIQSLEFAIFKLRLMIYNCVVEIAAAAMTEGKDLSVDFPRLRGDESISDC